MKSVFMQLNNNLNEFTHNQSETYSSHYNSKNCKLCIIRLWKWVVNLAV